MPAKPSADNRSGDLQVAMASGARRAIDRDAARRPSGPHGDLKVAATRHRDRQR
jgi:hypothetical protein